MLVSVLCKHHKLGTGFCRVDCQNENDPSKLRPANIDLLSSLRINDKNIN